jgi:hypothetical protein
MRFLLKSGFFATVLLISGCAGGYIGAPTTADDIARGTQLVRDEFKKEERWVSKFIRSGDGSTNATIVLVKVADVIAIQIDLVAQDWVFFRTVRDLTGAELPMVKIDSRVSSQAGYIFCTETFKVTLEPSIFSTARKEGLVLKFYGQRGDAVIEMPSFFFEGFASAMDAPSKKSKAESPPL